MYPPTMFKSKVRKGIPLQTSIKVGYKASLYYKGEKGHVKRKPVFGVSDKYLHKPSFTTTGDELRIRKEGLYYLRSKNNGADQICAFVLYMHKSKVSLDTAHMSFRLYQGRKNRRR